VKSNVLTQKSGPCRREHPSSREGAAPAAARARRGFTLMELLLSMLLLAVLMASVAAAINASVNSYQENDRIASATQAARSILMRMMQEVRTCDDVSATPTSMSIAYQGRSDGLSLIKYEFTGGSFLCSRTINGSTSTQALLASSEALRVNSFSVSSISGTDSGGQACTKSTSARLELIIDGKKFSVTSSADPRRNLTY